MNELNAEPKKIADIVICIITAAVAAGLTVGLGEKAKNPKMTVFEVIVEMMTHAFSGTVIGLISTNVTKDIMLISAFAAIGGFIGSKALYGVYNLAFFLIANMKGIKPEDLKKMECELKDDEKDKT